MGSAERRRPPVRKRRWARALSALVLVLGVVVLAAMLALRTERVRGAVARAVTEFLNSSLRGRFSVGSVQQVSPTFAVVRDFEVRDQDGRLVLRAPRAEATLDLGPLLRHGDLVLSTAKVDGAWVSLHARGDTLAIADVFLPKQPSTAPTTEPSERPWLFQIRHAVLTRASAAEIPGGFAANGVVAEGELSYSDGFRLRLQRAGAQARHARGAHGTLRVERFALRLGPNEESDLKAELLLGGNPIDVALTARWADGFTDARAQLRATLTPEGLAAGGATRAATALRSRVEVAADARWEAQPQRLALQASIEGGGGRVILDAQRTPEKGRAWLHTPGLEPSQLFDLPGSPSVAFDLTLDTERVGTAHSFQLHARELRYGAQTFPESVAFGSADAHGVHLSRLELPSFRAQRGVLQVDVQADYTGNLRAQLSASLPRVTPQSRLGRLSHARSEALGVRAQAQYDVSADKLRAEATLQVAGLRSADAFAGRVSATLKARGKLLRPTLAAEARVRDLRFGALRVDTAEASAKGGPVLYTVSARAQARGAQAEVDLNLALGQHEQRLSGSGRLRGWLPKPVQLSLQELRIKPDQILVQALRASAGSSVLAVDGSYGRTRASDLHVRLEQLAFHLPFGPEQPAREGLRGLHGHVSAHLHLTGTTQLPELELSLDSADLALGQRALGELRVRASLASRLHLADAQLWLTRAEGDTLQLSLGAALPEQGPWQTRFDRAQYTLEARAAQNVGWLAQLMWPERSSELPAGALELSAHLAGPWRKPLGTISVVGKQLAVPGELPVDAKIEARLAAADSHLTAALTDPRGPLAEVAADVEADLFTLLEALQHSRARQLRARYAVHMPERRLAQLPRALQSSLPVALALNAELLTTPDAAPHAAVTLDARYLGDAADKRCPQLKSPRVRLAASVAEERLQVELEGLLADRPALHATLRGAMPTLTELKAGRFARGLQLALDVNDLDLAQLPGVCADWSGRIRGGLRVEELFTERPKLAGQLHARALRYQDTGAVDASLGARADRSRLELVAADVHKVEQRVLQGQARLPWRWDGAQHLELDAAHCEVEAQVSDFPLADLAPVLPGIAQPSGTLSGQIALRGCNDASGLRGTLTLRRAGFTVKEPLLRAEELEAELRLSPNAIELASLKLSDQGGTLRGHGRVAIAGGRPNQGSFTFRANEFPLRTDAKVSGYLDGKVQVALQWSGVPRRVKIALDEISIRLPQRTPNESQSLERHADVTYVDAPAAARVDAAPAPAVPLELNLIATQPFWVKGNELSTQLKLDLKLSSRPEGVQLRGEVQVVRGFLNLFSKGFDIDRGKLIFDGVGRIDPTVTIDAVHKLGDGQTVTVHIRDRLSAPAVTFSTSVAGITSDAEILQLLVRGREASAAQTAQAQVGAALAGMTSELLGSLANTRMGKYVPVLSLEAGASSGTRIRAGVEANSLIPAKLRNVVEGAYVEGFVGSRNQGGNATATGGVLMELYFPKDLVTGGTWELPNNWSVELTWEP